MTRGKFTREKQNMDAVSDAATAARCRTIAKHNAEARFAAAAAADAAADRSPPRIMANVACLSPIVYVAYKSRVVSILLLPCQSETRSPESARRFSFRGSFALRCVSRCKTEFQCARRDRSVEDAGTESSASPVVLCDLFYTRSFAQPLPQQDDKTGNARCLAINCNQHNVQKLNR